MRARPCCVAAQGVPDQWGQPASGGTKFLGTPDNYMELLKTRPVSPDLFGVNGAAPGVHCALLTRSCSLLRRSLKATGR